MKLSLRQFISGAAFRYGCCFLFGVMLLPEISFSKDCKVFEPWLKLYSSRPKNIRERTDKAIALVDLQLNIVEEFYREYSEGLGTDDWNKCLSKMKEKESWEASISQIFFKNSISKLQKSEISLLKDLMKSLASTQVGQGMTLFKAAPHFPGSEGNKKAGVYRGSTSLFMNISLIPSSEWNFLMVHELSHYTDSVIKSASNIWNDKTIVNKIFELSKNHQSLSSLDVKDREMVQMFVQAGLDRGLLAEYRAWILCFSIYEEGISTGLWGKIPWMEEIVSQKLPHESWEVFTFNYLDGRFKDPEFSGVFSLLIVQEQYFELRERLRK